ncbi:MAG TPA: cytochrome c3 family protein [Anaeromyxobacter sp.]|nr:cytochrome c3 family protein [Anaeromyxobacter sp.]
MTTRLALAALVLAAASGCVRRGAGDGRVADPDVPPRSAFEVYPVEQIAGVKDPHDYRGKPLCQRCHLPDLKLVEAPDALCAGCHHFAHGNHPVNVVQKAPAGDLPLEPGGKVACYTCHDPHRKGKVLRKEFNTLCQSCHKRH